METVTEKRAIETNYEEIGKNAAIDFCVFPHNVDSPMTDSSLARLFYQHLPEFGKLENGQAEYYGENGLQKNAAALAKSIERDMVEGRSYADWLNAKLSPESKAMFAQGKDNSLNPMLDKLAKIGGYERNDIIAQETAAQQQPEPATKQRDTIRQAAFHALGLGFGR